MELGLVFVVSILGLAVAGLLAKHILKKDFIISGIITILIVFAVFRLKGIAIFLFISVFSYIFTKYVKKKINGITGDTLGAINEISEVLVLILLNIK